MSSAVPGAADQARAEMAPLLRTLCALLQEEGAADQYLFFNGILEGVMAADDDVDLAGPFMELSTAAFRGFLYSPSSTLLIDRILESAQVLSMTLSASGDASH